MIRIVLSLLFFLVATASSVWANDLAETAEARFLYGSASAISQKASELGTPSAIYEYVRNDFDYFLYHGARNDSVSVFLGKGGNDVDLASLLVAMYRSRNIPARYASGVVRIRSQAVMDWLGVRNVDLAYRILREAGIQKVALAQDKSYLEFEHVWVEALVSYSNYRGAGNDAVYNCSGHPSSCRWIALDPSFKAKSMNQAAIDIESSVTVDYGALFNAMKTGNQALMNKNPLEIFEENTLSILRTSNPGKTLEDVVVAGQVIPEETLILPASLPYEVVGAVSRYDSVSDHDAVQGVVSWTKYLNGTLTFLPDSAEPATVHFSVPVAKLSAKPFSLSFDLRDSVYHYMDLNLGDGIDSWFSAAANSPYFALGAQFSMDLTLDIAPSPDPGGTGRTAHTTYDYCKVGGQYMIATGGAVSGMAHSRYAKERLLELKESYPVVYGPEPAKEPYVDMNGNGVFDASDILLLDQYEANTWMTNGLLYAAQTLYYGKLRDHMNRAAGLNHSIAPIEGFLGVLSTVHEVEYLDDTPFAIMPGGLLIDVKEQVLQGPWRIDQSQTGSPKTFELLGYIGSSLEHEIWQELTGYDAVSTVRGIQMAIANNGAELLNIRKNDTQDTLSASYPKLGFSATPPLNALTYDTQSYLGGYMGMYYTQFNKQIRGYWTYLSPSAPDATMEVFKKTVDSTTSTFRRSIAWYPFSATSNLTNVIDSYFANLQGLYFNSGSTVTNWNTDREQRYSHYPNAGFMGVLSGTYYDFKEPVGALGDGSSPTLWEGFCESFYNFYQANSQLIDFFDIRKGYNESEYVFRRESGITEDQYDVHTIVGIRDDLCDYQSGNYWNEYVIPSRKTSVPHNRFMVYVWKAYEKSTNNVASMQFLIQNEYFTAGGGYVEESGGTLDPAQDSTGQVFNNAVFTDQNTVAQVNNDQLRTPSTVDPVSTVTGNNYHDETDFAIKGRGLDIAFTRTYNSAPSSTKESIPLGYGWTHSYNMKLKSNDYGDCPNCAAGTGSGQRPENGNNKTSSITYVDERGGEHSYLVNESTYAVTLPKGEFDTLALDTPSSGYYTVTFRNGVKYVFQGTNLKTAPGNVAKLARIEDPYGNQLLFTYTDGNLTAVTDNLGVSGRTGLTLTYTTGNQLKDITDWTGRKWSYAYDGSSNLVSVTNPLNKTIQYTYHAGTHNLNEVVLPEARGGRLVRTAFKYYQNGRTFSYTNSLGHTESLDYDLYRKITRVTDPRGFIREYQYNADGLMTKLTEPDNAILLFDNSADSLRYKKTDPLGYPTTYSYRADRAFTGASDTGGNVTLEKDPLANTLEYDYGVYDQVTRVKDKSGNVRTLAYYTTTNPATGAVAGKLQSVTLASLNGASNVVLEGYTYNPDGTVKQTVEQIDPANPSRKRITDYVWQDNGLNLQSVTVSGSGQTVNTAFTYDTLGRKKTETLWRRKSQSDATLIGLTTTYDYDALNRVAKVTDSLGNYLETIYDGNGKVYQVKGNYKNPDATFDTRIISTMQYDAADRLISDTDIYGNVTRFAYDEAGNLIKTIDPNGHATRYEYDAMNRKTAVIDANGFRTETVYDLAGRAVATINPLGKSVKTDYDKLGRPVTITDALDYQTKFVYDANGNVMMMTDANAVAGLQPKNSLDATVYTEYDELNRVKREVDALNGETKYTYDLLGNITSIIDAENRTTYLDYDDLGMLIQVRDPLVETPTDKVVTFTYDQAGNVLTRTKRSGGTATYTYDDLNRLTQAQHGSITESTVYDIYGNKYSVGNPDVTYTFEYDLKNRLTKKTDSRVNKSLSYSYGKAGEILTKTNYDGSTTEYRYDSANRLVAERNPDFLQVSYHYDGAGRLLNRILSNGSKTDYIWDDGNRLTSLKNTSANGTVVNNTTYVRDRLGNITGQTDAGGTTAFTYDALYRLTNADYPGTSNDQSFTYDKVGNRKTMTKAGSTLAYISDAGNRLKEVRQGSITGPLQNSFVYDDDGNLITNKDGSGTIVQAITYDAKGRANNIQGNTFKYDPFDYRIFKSDSHGNQTYLLEGEHLEGIMSGLNWQAKFLRGVVIDEVVNGFQWNLQGKWTNYTFHHDMLQSVLGLSGHEGSVLQTIQYGPFGEKIGTTGSANNNSLLYTGREEDTDSGLYNYRARIYDPTVGRFITEDPKGFAAGINFYTYVENDPINYNDPTGHIKIPGLGAATKAITKWAANNVVRKHHTVPTEILNKYLPKDIANNPLVRGKKGDPNIWKIPGNVHDQIHTGAGGGPWNQRWKEELKPFGPNGENATVEDVVGIRNKLAKEFGLEQYRPGSETAVSWLNQTKGYVAGAVFLGIEALDYTDPYSAFCAIMGAKDAGAGSDIIPGLTVQVIGFDMPSNQSSAGGGFVIYPNKPNSNMMRSVYAK